MEMPFGDGRYWTVRFEDRKAGCVGYRLHCERFGKLAVAAEVVFWDAAGGFTIRTVDGDVPVEVIEAAIAEAKREIKTR
jgi:hypothetical protein